MSDKLVVKVKCGCLVATISPDPDYPGIDVEYVPDNYNSESLSRPRVLVEWPHDGELRALIWNNPNYEDYTEDIPMV